MYQVIVLCDSRGNGLYHRINSLIHDRGYTTLLHVQVASVPGARLQDLYYELVARNPTLYDLVVVFAGVNHLTEKHLNNRITPIYYDVHTLVESLTDKFCYFRDKMHSLNLPVAFAQMIGVDLNMFNHSHNMYAHQQQVIDIGIPILNDTIVGINEEFDLIGPWTQATVYYKNGAGNINAKYSERLYDGLHATPTTKNYWAKCIGNAIIANYQRSTP